MKKVSFDFDGVLFDRIKNNLIIENTDILAELINQGCVVFIESTKNKHTINNMLGMLGFTARYGIKTEIISSDNFNWENTGVLGIANHKVERDVMIDDKAINYNPKRKALNLSDIKNFTSYYHKGKYSK